MDHDVDFGEYDQYGPCICKNEESDLFISITLDDDNSIHQNIFSNIENNDQIFYSIMKECKYISKKINVHPLVAFLILETQHWNIHLVYENWINYQDSILEQLGFDLENVLQDPSLAHPNIQDDEEIECEVCCDTYTKEEMWCLPCGHSFCKECWKAHVNSQVSYGQHLINCQSYDCHCKLPPNSVEMLCGREVYNDFLRFLMNQAISISDILTNCPSCSTPVNLLSSGLCNVLTCSCGHEFCSFCYSDSHAPATCIEKSLWEKSTTEDAMKQRILGENCKYCPKCNCIIEKNGGCNHMKCKNCNHEFCWICLGDWSKHGSSFFECKFYNKNNDLYLKKQKDNINSELINPYHDKFVSLEKLSKKWKEEMEKISDLVYHKVYHEHGTSKRKTKRTVLALMKAVYWTIENCKWGQVHLFNQRYQRVKRGKLEDQINEKKYPNTSEYNLLKFSLEETEKLALSMIKKIKKIASSDSQILLTYISSMMKRIRVQRDSLLKHCDNHG